MVKSKSKKKKSLSVATGTPHPLKLWVETDREQEVRIEILPLIDVIFCILVFFILAALTFSRQQAIKLDLPKAATGAPQMRDMLVVSLDDVGQVYVEKKPILTQTELVREVSQYNQSSPNGLIVLNASRNVSYNEVVNLLDKLRELGGERVALATLPGEGNKSVLLNPYQLKNPIQPNISPNLGQQPGISPIAPTNPLNPLTPSVPTAPNLPGTPSNKN